jgi:hypothetical protein
VLFKTLYKKVTILINFLLTLDIDYSNMLYCINVHKIGVSLIPVRFLGASSLTLYIIPECWE